MKTALFCSKPLSVCVLTSILPDRVTEIISASGVDFGAELVSKRINCPYRYTKSVDEAIEQAECIVAVWDGRTPEVISAVRQAERIGKRVLLSFMP